MTRADARVHYQAAALAGLLADRFTWAEVCACARREHRDAVGLVVDAAQYVADEMLDGHDEAAR